MRPARILILRGGALGDFIVTLPALTALRRRWPDAHMELIGYPHVARLALTGGLIDTVRSLNEAGLARYFVWNAPLPDEDQTYFASFDFILNFLHDPDGVLADNFKRCGVKVLLPASPLVRDRHAVDHFLKPLESLAIYVAPPIPELGIPAPPECAASLPSPWLAIHPGSGSSHKNWPIASFVALARQAEKDLGLHPVFFTGDAEREYIPDLDQALDGFPRFHNLDLPQVAGIIGRATLYVGNDSGISHLAAAVGCPSLVLFGPSRADLWAPRGPRVRILHSPTGAMPDLGLEEIMREMLILLKKAAPT